MAANLTQASSGTFSIHGKGLKLTTREDAEPYVKALQEMGEEVNRIHLGGNTLGIEACQALASVIATKSNLQIADFADIFTGRLISEIPLALEALCDALVGLSKLIEVDLSDNAFGGRVAEPMVKFLTQNNTFKTLRLTNNGMGPTGGSVIAQAILQNAKSTTEPKITTVICGRNRLENGSAPLFADAYAALGPSLKEVRMVQNGIRMEGIAALARGLRKCPNLEVLDLQDNTAAVVGSRAIASSLKYWPKLKHLNLSDCLLRPKGALLIMEALKEGHNTELESLKLQSDEVDAKAVEVLADAVKLHLKKLSVVELNGNRVEPDDEAMNKLREALEANGFEDAIDEIDDVEEVDEEEDEEEAEELESEDEDEQAALGNKVLVGKVETGGEDVRADEADIVRQDKTAEISEPTQPADKKEDDELASLMSKAGI